MNHLNMNEAFRRWPLGMSTFPSWVDLYGAMFREWHGNSIPFDDWLFERLRPLLTSAARAQYQGVHTFNKWYTWTNGSAAECLRATLSREQGHAYRIILLDGTVVREWPIDEYDGIF